MSKEIDKIIENKDNYALYASRIGVAAALIVNVSVGLAEKEKVQGDILKVTKYIIDNLPKDLQLDSIEKTIRDLIEFGFSKIDVPEDYKIIITSAGLLVSDALIASIRRLEARYPDKFKDADGIYSIIYALFKAFHETLVDTFNINKPVDVVARGTSYDRCEQIEAVLARIG